MAQVRAYIQRYRLTLLNAAVIGVVYVVGIAARPHAAVGTVTRIHDWFGIAPEVALALFVLSMLAMATPWYAVKYLALIMPGIYAAAAFGYAWGLETLTLVAGLQHGAMVAMMVWGVRMEQRAHDDE